LELFSFDEKYNMNMEKLMTLGLSSKKIFYRGALLLRGKEDKMKLRNYVSTSYKFEVLQKKRGIGLQLHFFLGAEFLELKVFGNAELERS
jgi:hypothetical protein